MRGSAGRARPSSSSSHWNISSDKLGTVDQPRSRTSSRCRSDTKRSVSLTRRARAETHFEFQFQIGAIDQPVGTEQRQTKRLTRVIHSNDKALEKKTPVCDRQGTSLSLADQRFSSDRVVTFQQMFVVTFSTFAIEIDLFREPLGVVVRGDLSDEVNIRDTKRENERESEVAISCVPMLNDVSHWVEGGLVRRP